MGKHTKKGRVQPERPRLERGDSLLIEQAAYFDKGMQYGYWIGVLLRFGGMAFIYLAYLTAVGNDFYDKIKMLAGQRLLITASVLLVFSIIIFLLAIRKLALMRRQSSMGPTDLEMVRLERH